MQVCHLPWFMCMYIWSYFFPIAEVDSLSSCLWAYLQPAWYSITCLSYSEYNGTNAQMLHFQSMERAFVPACGDEDSWFCCWIDHAGLCFGYQKMGWCLCCFLRMCPLSFCTWKFYLSVTVCSVYDSENPDRSKWCYRSVWGGFHVPPMC